MQSSTPSAAPPRRPATRRARASAVALSLGVHALVLTALVLPRPAPPQPSEPEAIRLALVTPPPIPPRIPARVIDKPTVPAKPSAPPPAFRRTPVPRDLAALPAQARAQGLTGIGDGELDGAATAEAGAPGGGCDMIRALQTALRQDALVQTAVASAGRGAAGVGKAILVWNGDWVTTPGEDGRGLSAVREAILWQVGFSPPGCRSAWVHGFVAISLSDGPGAPRLVLGGGDWRWSDLLTPRGFNRGGAG